MMFSEDYESLNEIDELINKKKEQSKLLDKCGITIPKYIVNAILEENIDE